MMIDPKAGLGNLATQQSQRSNSRAPDSRSSQTEAPAAGGDSVRLSKEALSLKKLEDNIAKAPVVDQDRVASLKAAIADGSYKIDPERLAERILGAEGL